MSNLQLKGRFRVSTIEAEPLGVYPNRITDEGVQRVLELMGGQSRQTWSGIRLVAADGSGVFVQKSASTELQTGRLISTALFTSADITFDVGRIEMYSGQTRVAEAPAEIPAGQTVVVEREDLLNKGG